MWVALVPSGMDWLDTEIGGVPAAGVVAAIGAAGSGKTSLALGFAIAQLRRQGRVCYLTSETPEAVIETCRGMMELDLRPFVGQGSLTLLSFAPFFVNKVRSLNSNDPPLAELKELFDERRIQHIVFDTLDPMLSWIEGSNAKVSVRNLLGQIQGWGRSVVCTMSGTTPAATELARTASGSIELGDGKLIVRHAGWCNVYDIEAPLQFVQGRGSVVRANAGRKPAGKSPAMSDMSLIAASPLLPESERRPNESPPSHKPWMSLIGDANKILGPQAVIIASKDIFQQGERSQPPPPMSAASREPSPPTPRLASSPQIINQPQPQQQHGSQHPPPQQQQQHGSQHPPPQQQQQHGSQHPPPQQQQQHGSQHPPPQQQQHGSQHPPPYRAPFPSPAAPFAQPQQQQHPQHPQHQPYPTGPQPINPMAVSAMAANAMAAAAQAQAQAAQQAAQGGGSGRPPGPTTHAQGSGSQHPPPMQQHQQHQQHKSQHPQQYGSQHPPPMQQQGNPAAAHQSYTGPRLPPDPYSDNAAATTAYQGRPVKPVGNQSEPEVAPISLIPNAPQNVAPAAGRRPDASDMAATTAYNKPPAAALDPDEVRTLFRPADLNQTAGPRPLEPPRIDASMAGTIGHGPPSSSKTLVTSPVAPEEQPGSVTEDPTHIMRGGNQVRLGPSVPRPAAGSPSGPPPGNNRRR